MPTPNRLVPLVALAFIAVATASGTQAAALHAGECGEFKYWHNGQCVDARTKPGKNWTAGVYL